MPAISVSVQADLYSDLQKAAERTGFTKSKITELALRAYLKELNEDAADAETADEAYREFIESAAEPIAASEVYKKLGL